MKRLRILLSLMLAVGTLLTLAAPALGYHDPNVRDLRIRRLDPIQCGQPITLEATVWRRGGGTVPGVTVDWSFLEKGKRVIVPGDTLVPTSSVSDANGKAYTELTLVCEPAKRLIQGEHPGDARDRITIECNRRRCAAPENGDSESMLPPVMDPKAPAPPTLALATDVAPMVVPGSVEIPLTVNLMGLAGAAGVILLLQRRLRPRSAGPPSGALAPA